MNNKISHQKAMDSMVRKLTRLNAKSRTINAFKVASQSIITSNYNVINRLKMLHASIAEEKPTMSTSKKTIKESVKEFKTQSNMRKYGSKIDQIKAFTNNRQALAGMMADLGKYKKNKVVVQNLPITYKGRNMIQIKFSGSQTRSQIEAYGNKLSKRFERDGVNGIMSIALRYDKGWRSGYFSKFGEPVELYDPDMYDNDHHHYVETQEAFSKYVIYLTDLPQAHAGYDDVYNDCFYNCLKFVLHDGVQWKTPAEFKKFLGIGRDEKVDIFEHIPKVEKKLGNIAINVSGEYIYTSPIKSNKTINLKIADEHVTVDTKIYSKIEKFSISHNERKPIIYNTSTFMCFDGENEYKISKEIRNSIFKFKTDSILIVKRDNKLTMKEEFDEFIRDDDKLKKVK
jgi:hypothetical protein